MTTTPNRTPIALIPCAAARRTVFNPNGWRNVDSNTGAEKYQWFVRAVEQAHQQYPGHRLLFHQPLTISEPGNSTRKWQQGARPVSIWMERLQEAWDHARLLGHEVGVYFSSEIAEFDPNAPARSADLRLFTDRKELLDRVPFDRAFVFFDRGAHPANRNTALHLLRLGKMMGVEVGVEAIARTEAAPRHPTWEFPHNLCLDQFIAGQWNRILADSSRWTVPGFVCDCHVIDRGTGTLSEGQWNTLIGLGYVRGQVVTVANEEPGELE